jgi:hypothetical protein
MSEKLIAGFARDEGTGVERFSLCMMAGLREEALGMVAPAASIPWSM